MLNCILIQDKHNANVNGVILTEMGEEDIYKIFKDTHKSEEDDDTDFIEKLKEKGCTIYGINGAVYL